MSQDPIAAILQEAEANRRRERSAQASAGTVSTPAAAGDTTVQTAGAGGTGSNNAAGNPVVLDANGKIPAALMYPPSAAQVARTYTHVQGVASTLWTIVHGLGGYPPPVVLDPNGAAMNGEVHYPDDNTVTVTFGRPQLGTAHLSL